MFCDPVVGYQASDGIFVPEERAGHRSEEDRSLQNGPTNATQGGSGAEVLLKGFVAEQIS